MENRNDIETLHKLCEKVLALASKVEASHVSIVFADKMRRVKKELEKLIATLHDPQATRETFQEITHNVTAIGKELTQYDALLDHRDRDN